MKLKSVARNALAGASMLAMSLSMSTGVFAETWVEKSNEYSQQLLNLMGKYQPEFAAQVGVTGVEANVFDLKENVVDRYRADSMEIVATLKAQMANETDPALLQDMAIMVKALEDGAKTLELQNSAQLPYFNVPQMIFGGFQALLGPGSDASRHAQAVTRLKRYAGLEDGYTPIVELAMARTRERMGNMELKGPYIKEVEQDLERMPTFIDGIDSLFEGAGLEGWEDAVATLKEQLADYRAFIEDEIKPRARQNARLPRPLYEDALKATWGVDASPEELIELATLGYANIKNEMKALAVLVAEEKGYASHDYRDVIAKLKEDNIPGDQLKEFYEDVIAKLEEIAIREGLVTIPERDAQVRIMTAAETAQQPAPNLQPPRFVNSGPKEYPTFRLPLLKKNEDGSWKATDETFRANAWTLSAHEARPGHELQFASMVDNGVSLARQLYAFNSTNVEGWALYAEAISKPYMPLDAQLVSLQHRLLRAARAFLDPMLNLGLIDAVEAKRILTEDVMLSDAWAQNEIERYTYRIPGQAPAYFYGYSKLQALRTEVELALADKFDAKAFHDFILAQGLLPPMLMRQAVMERFVPSQL
ncbi:DUF885 domain-containing protein [Kordiimonas lipolytica]|uniref:DUF885 domain-containing protein n=1 Tax=Kordiimonas lipolytica TaxID=1662421 RepID=A0ABV8UB00_9PROT|nr:DUF885 domain-containing protein [Kordiimonas lipolytica]